MSCISGCLMHGEAPTSALSSRTASSPNGRARASQRREERPRSPGPARVVILTAGDATVSKPIILCGLGRVGWRVLEFLQAARIPVVAVDDRCEANDARLCGARLVRGDCRRRETLEQAG